MGFWDTDQWHQVDHMQKNHLAPRQHLITHFYRPDALPDAQPTVSKHWRHQLEKTVSIISTQLNDCRQQLHMPVRTAKWCSPHWISTSRTFCRKSFAPNNVLGICCGVTLLECLGPLPRMPKPHVNSSLFSAGILQSVTTSTEWQNFQYNSITLLSVTMRVNVDVKHSKKVFVPYPVSP